MTKLHFLFITIVLFLIIFIPAYKSKAAIPASVDAFGQIFQIQNWPNIFKVDVLNKDADDNIKIKSQGVVDVNVTNYPPASKIVWVWQNAVNVQNGEYSPIFETNGWNKMYFDVRQTNPSSCSYSLKLLSSFDGNNWVPQKVYIYNTEYTAANQRTYIPYNVISDTAITDVYGSSIERTESFVKAPYYRFQYYRPSGDHCQNEVLNTYVYLTQTINSFQY